MIGLSDHSQECALLSQSSKHEKIGELLERTGDWKYEIIAVLRILLTGGSNKPTLFSAGNNKALQFWPFCVHIPTSNKNIFIFLKRYIWLLHKLGLDNPCFRDLLDNVDKLKADIDEWTDFSDSVVTFLRQHFGDKWTVSDIERSAGILRTNAYCVEAGDSATHGMVRIIYPQLSMM